MAQQEKIVWIGGYPRVFGVNLPVTLSAGKEQVAAVSPITTAPPLKGTDARMSTDLRSGYGSVASTTQSAQKP